MEKYTLEIIQDNDAEAPLDDVCKIITWHRDYSIGDKHEYKTPRDFAEYIWSKYKDAEPLEDSWPEEILILPIYAYIHSGITISTSSYSCQWDSGQIGWIYIENSVAEKEGILNPTEYLQGVVATYDQYLTGDVWGYVIKEHFEPCKHCNCTPKPETVDSCWGFYGHENAESEGAAALKHLQNKSQEQLSLNLK